MSKYSQSQEYRLKRYFENHPDITLLEYYGSRVKNAGDFLIIINRKQCRVDHKSTTSDTRISIQKDWLPVLGEYNLNRMTKDGCSISFITFSLKSRRTIYVLQDCYPMSFGYLVGIKSGKQSFGIKGKDLAKVNLKVDFDGYTAYITTLERMIERIKDG